MTKLLEQQYGGDHYKSMVIQPMEYSLANRLGYCEATAIKYISRWQKKGGVTDLEKAIHFLEILKEDAINNPYRYELPK